MQLEHTGAPRPRPAFRVGVTGQRLAALYEGGVDLAALRAGVRAVVALILQAVDRTAADWATTYEGQPLVHLVSPLRDGADQIVAEEAVQQGCTLHVPLPYLASIYAPMFPTAGDAASDDPRHVFERLIARADVVRVLNGDPGALCDPAHDRAVERYVLRHADVLIAVGDGASGPTSQADDATTQEHARHLPIIRIDPHRPDRWTLQGGPRAGSRADPPSRLCHLVRQVLAPPTDPHEPGVAVAALRAYLTTPARWALGGLYACLVKTVAGEGLAMPIALTRGRQFLARAADEWVTMLGVPRNAYPELTDPLTRTMMRYYVWAEGLGYRYGLLHRDTSSAPYVFAPIAVLLALAAHFWRPRPWGLDPAWWGVGEAVVLIIILTVFYRHAIKGRYHDRWIDYRSLAEQLRQLTFLWLLGEPPSPPRLEPEAQGEAPPLAWVDWYVQAVAREAGVFPGVLTPERLLTVRRVLAEQFIRHQCAYHDRAARRAGAVYHRLHRAGLWVFVGALGVAVLDLLVLALPRAAAVGGMVPAPLFAEGGWLSVGLGILAIVLPAIGASIHGFVSQGDFRNLSTRSRRMCDILNGLAERVDAAPPAMDALARLAAQAASVMSEEIVYWRVFVRLKPPSLV